MIRIQLPGELRFRSVIVRTVAAACRLARSLDRSVSEAEAAEAAVGEALDLSHDFDAKMVSAVSEAFNNIVIHAYRGRKPAEVALEIELGETQVQVRLFDSGESIDQLPSEEPDLDSLPEGGLGLFIIQSFVDEFHYTPGKPNQWSMTKAIPARR